MAHGYGRFIYSTGAVYEGQIVRNLAEGVGTFDNESVGYVYKGQWANDAPNGRG